MVLHVHCLLLVRNVGWVQLTHGLTVAGYLCTSLTTLCCTPRPTATIFGSCITLHCHLLCSFVTSPHTAYHPHSLLSFMSNTQIGMSKDRMLRLFHPDALDLLNITNSLKQVCEDLASPSFRMARKVIAGWFKAKYCCVSIM